MFILQVQPIKKVIYYKSLLLAFSATTNISLFFALYRLLISLLPFTFLLSIKHIGSNKIKVILKHLTAKPTESSSLYLMNFL